MCLVLTRTAKALFSNAINLQYDKPRIATAVEVSQGSYVARSNKLVKRQQAHVVIEIYY